MAVAGAASAQPLEAAEELQVRVENNSAPELCAEKDNIELDFISPRVRSLQIQAVHPSYINTIASDRWAPDWSSCDLTVDPKAFSQARRKTFWETPEFWLTGYTFPSFWRPNDVPVRVGDTVERGFHLIQFWMWHRERAEETDRRERRAPQGHLLESPARRLQGPDPALEEAFRGDREAAWREVSRAEGGSVLQSIFTTPRWKRVTVVGSGTREMRDSSLPG